ncbi:MAG: GNAT family N-acetyltransferase [Acidovorax sp.]|uniref:GNAT family N-acetyltransferase n=1 Tax=Acidovorax sp. TaxID=1872122 RepID=UPI00391D7D2B
MKPASPMSCETGLSGIPAELQLREADAADLVFLRALYRTVRDPELMLTPWAETERQAFSDSQFALQDRHYRAHYPGALLLVIEHQGVPVGRLYLGTAPGPLRLMDLAFMPSWRGRGWGTALVRAVVGRAYREARDTLLFVESNNPAYRLYGREGFADEGVEGVYRRMRRRPVPVRSAD